MRSTLTTTQLPFREALQWVDEWHY